MDLINFQNLSASKTEGLDPLGSTGTLSTSSDGQEGRTLKQAEEELKSMQQQIESYNLMYQQLINQQKMAAKKLTEMDEKIRDRNKEIEEERVFVGNKEKEVKERREKLKILKEDQNFDPFAADDPFDGDDPFTSASATVALPEDDPFNPSSSARNLPAFISPADDPFAPSAGLSFPRGDF